MLLPLEGIAGVSHRVAPPRIIVYVEHEKYRGIVARARLRGEQLGSRGLQGQVHNQRIGNKGVIEIEEISICLGFSFFLPSSLEE